MDYPRIVSVGNVSLKIYRQRHNRARTGWVYSIATKSSDGKRKLVQMADEGAAYAKAVEVATALAQGETETALMPRSDLNELRNARKMCGGFPLLSAIEEWKKIREISGGQGIAAAEAWRAANGAKSTDPVAIEHAIEAFIAAKNAAGLQGELTYGRKLKGLVKHFKERAIQDISEAELSRFLQGLKDPVYHNDVRSRCITFWRWCRDKKGWMPKNVMLPIEQTSLMRETPKRIGIITPNVFKQCLEWVRENQPEDLAALVLAGFCGIRSDEIHGKRHDRSKRQLWSDVYLKKRVMNVTVAKVNTPQWRLVPLCDAAIAWLKICNRREDGLICRSCAMEWVRKGCIGARIDLPENCFRHSFISYRIAALDGNKQRAATDAGTSVTKIDRHYRVPLVKSEGEAWFAIRPRGTGQD